VAYVWDEDGDFARRCNMAMVSLEPVLSTAEQQAKLPQATWHAARRGGTQDTDEAILRGLIEAHFRHTGSVRAREILTQWASARARFVKVFPNEYKRALGELAQARKAAGQPA
jgi:glutamate synthase (NADPH/NADH) large chain